MPKASSILFKVIIYAVKCKILTKNVDGEFNIS